MKQKNYPLYETTVFENFRVMTENAATKFGEDPALIFRLNPHDAEPVTKNFIELRDDCRNFGTGLVACGAREKHCAIIGGASYGWVISYFALMSIGAVTVPIDKELPAEEIADILKVSECEFAVYSAPMERKIEQVAALLHERVTWICMGEPAMAGALRLTDVLADGAERYAAGDNTYYDYEIDTDRLATIVFTSGTTGKGKGVMLSQKTLSPI